MIVKAVFSISKSLEYSSKSDTYKILSLVGQLAKRIDRMGNFLGPEEIKSLNSIASVLKAAFPELNAQIEEIVICFSTYLDKHVSRSRTNNVYAVLGPVKDLLQKIRKDTGEREELIDFMLELHQMTNKFGSNLPLAAKEALIEGIGKILDIISRVSYQEKRRLLQYIEDELYYQRRVKDIENLTLHLKKLIS